MEFYLAYPSSIDRLHDHLDSADVSLVDVQCHRVDEPQVRIRVPVGENGVEEAVFNLRTGVALCVDFAPEAIPQSDPKAAKHKNSITKDKDATAKDKDLKEPLEL